MSGNRRVPLKPRQRISLESLESRVVPYTASGSAWVKPELVTIGFVPDGTVLGTGSNGNITSNLQSTFNTKFGTNGTWQTTILRAAQVWAQQTNVNFAFVTDDGRNIGYGLYQQGDPTMADIRIGGYDLGSSILAQAYLPPQANNYSIAGDMQFNTTTNFNMGSTYDLFTVAMHEFGHALGLLHGVSGSVMAAGYTGLKTALATDDVNGIRAIYSGARTADSFDASASNETWATGSWVTWTINTTSKTAVMNGLDITSTADVDTYKFTVPAGLGGQLTVRVRSQGLSLLAPTMSFLNSSGGTVATVNGTQYGDDLVYVLTNATANTTYGIRVDGVETSALGTGDYAITMGFGGVAAPAPTLPNTTTDRGDPLVGGGGQAVQIQDEVLVNTTTAGQQSLGSRKPTAIDAAGNYVIVWTSSDGDGQGVFGQRFDNDGNKVGSQFRINQATAGDQRDPSVAYDSGTSFVVTWTGLDASGAGIYMRRYNSDGTAASNETLVNATTTNDQVNPSIARNATGNFVIVWQSMGQDGSSWGVYGQRYSPTGVKQGAEIRLSNYVTNAQTVPDVAIDNTGNFVATWASSGQAGVGMGNDVYAQRFNSTGARLGSEFRVNSTILDDAMDQRVVMSTTGQFVVVWDEADWWSRYQVWGQRYDASGSALGANFRIDTGNWAFNGSISMDGQGNLFAAWQDMDQGGIMGRQFNSSGVAVGSAWKINTLGGTTYVPALASNSQGYAVVCWAGPDGSEDGVYAKRYILGDINGQGVNQLHKLYIDGHDHDHDHDHDHADHHHDHVDPVVKPEKKGRLNPMLRNRINAEHRKTETTEQTKVRRWSNSLLNATKTPKSMSDLTQSFQRRFGALATKALSSRR